MAQVETALKAAPGVRQVDVSLTKKNANVRCSDKCDAAKLIAAVEGAGFKARRAN